MTYLRVALVCVLCGSCFKPEGKDTGGASESDATTEAATGTPTASTPTEALTTGSPTSETLTSGSPTSETLTSGSPTSETLTSSGETTGTASGVTTESVDTTTEVDSSGGSTGGEAVCGNSVVDEGELCDDGNMLGGDKCPGNCKGPCTNGVIDGNEACDDGNTVAADGCSPTCTRDGSYVFVTSELYTALLGGLGGADSRCKDLALKAKLPGKYKAWLSDETTSAKERVTPTGMQYVRTDGTLVAKNLESIVLGGPGDKLMAPINRTESKVEIKTPAACSQDGLAWTSTTGTGDVQPMVPCGDWQNNINPTMAVAGDIGVTTAAWTDGCTQLCTLTARLYCFEVPQ
ncbi:MAG: hypothetical protein IPO88_23035 [Nannocystis sp.]|uniref:hypothetical protein n=1 Tax=Nannocystis sp. TaxID=1962667 RepID=UPI00242865F5|nr:hypothetical protein [Nannocystis sp.]MBK9756319.1 hypothetical protein [Nannocystis sp.]